MKLLTPHTKKAGKQERERKVLLSLIEYYLKTGKPVGSNTLKEVEGDDLSSATIRNYFAHLEEEGYLLQQHISGGRVPTDKAYRLYAAELLLQENEPITTSTFNVIRDTDTREIASFLQSAAEKLMHESQLPVFLSAPRFEQDFIIGIKLVTIDADRCLCVLITDFGEVVSEILYPKEKLSTFSSKRIEAYFNWRLNGQNKPDSLSPSEEILAKNLYNELMVRYIVSYSQFEHEEIYRTGFSTLLTYPEFHDPEALSNSLALFENTHGMRLLLKECRKFDELKFWIGSDLATYTPHKNPNCAVIATPYHVNNQPVGAIGVLGPTRMPYRTLFSMLKDCANSITHALTTNLYKYKITMREPKQSAIDLQRRELMLIGQTKRFLLEDNRNN